MISVASDRAVAVTGVGAITPWGAGCGAFSEALEAGRSAVRAENLPPFESPRAAALIDRATVAASLDEGLRELNVSAAITRHLARGPLSLAASAVVAMEAWRQSGPTSPDESIRSGVVVGGNDLNMGHEECLRSKFSASPHYLPPSFAVHAMDSDHVGVVSALLQLRGEGFTLSAASASGGMALVQGVRLIRMGVLDRCLVIGALAELNPMLLQGLDALGALGGNGYADAPERASRPFDKDRNGFVYAQAAAALVLERASNARERGATVLGSVQGIGVCLDGTPLPSPSTEGEAAAMRLALADAGVAPRQIDTVNAHGTGSGAGDETELEAIVAVFGDHAASLKIQSTKGLLGHALWAAGTVEAVAVLLQIREDFLHPNLNLETPLRQDVGLVGHETTVPGPRMAMSNCFGFGGINTSVILTGVHGMKKT